VTLALRTRVPDVVDVGGAFTLTLAAPGSAGPHLAGRAFRILEADALLFTGALPASSDGEGYAAEIPLIAPTTVGAFTWMLVVPAHEVGDGVHEEITLPFWFKTRAHAASLAVWSTPSPAVVGETCKLKVGAKCLRRSCALGGGVIEILDGTGSVVSSQSLGDQPWQGTSGLYWAAVDVPAPQVEGHHFWSARLSASSPGLAHEASPITFSFVTVSAPDHVVSVALVQKGTDRPIPEADVRLGVYRGSTDARGVVTFAVPSGVHELFVWKPGYDTPTVVIEVTTSQAIRVEAVALPPENPDAFWQG
jgi:hypothetical protein